MTERTWTCRRVTSGVKCGAVNAKKFQICQTCGKRRPKTKAPAHRQILKDLPYEEWVVRFGEICGICGASPKLGKKLMRDHDHRTGYARGLLCWTCNHSLASWRDLAWHEAAVAYLKRALALQEDIDDLAARRET